MGLHGSYFVVNPVFSQVSGAAAGILQTVVQNYVEKRVARSGEIVHSWSFCLIGVQGMLGAAFATIWKVTIMSFINKSTKLSKI